MAAVIHPKWNKPMPRWWHDFYERDAAIFDEPLVLRFWCTICDKEFEPNGPRQSTCSPECRRKHKTRVNSEWRKARA